MAAHQPHVGGLPPPALARRSFADILIASPSHASPTADSSLPADSPPAGTQSLSGSHKGFPAITFQPSHIAHIARPFRWSLIGKFSQGFNKQNPKLGRPSVENLYDYFRSLDFKGDFTLGLLDNRHILIKLHLEEDYLRLYSRMVWYVGGIAMRIFKWTTTFHVDKESSLAPVWVSLPRLPVHFFDKSTLFQIVSLLGLPLRLDSATVTLKRPSIARVQVELDLLKARPHQLWIGIENGEGFWQKIDYEHVPSYCTHCWHVGHTELDCHVQYPDKKPAVQQVRQEYRPILKPVVESAAPPVPPAVAEPPLATAPQVQQGDPLLLNDPSPPVIPDSSTPLIVSTPTPQTSAPEVAPPVQDSELVQVDDASLSDGEGNELDIQVSDYPLPVDLCDDYLLIRRSPKLDTGPSTDPRPVSSSCTREEAFAELRNFGAHLRTLFPSPAKAAPSEPPATEIAPRRRRVRPRKYVDYQVSLPSTSHFPPVPLND